MSIHRFFKKQFALQSKAGEVAFLCLILLMSGCGEDDTINNPVGGGDAAEITPAPISSPYFPVTLGSRWTYRNPNGSEWSRHVAEFEVFDGTRYHSFSYTPPIKLDSLGSTEYVTFVDRIVRKTNLSQINDIVRDLILESGYGPTSWEYLIHCHQSAGQKPVCETDKNLFKPRIMTFLYYADTQGVWRSALVPLQYPVFPSQTYTALDLRLKGVNERGTYLYDLKAEGRILGRTGDDWESVQTPAGNFEKCLKIQYEPDLKSFKLVDFQNNPDAIFDDGFLRVARELIESELVEELNDLLPDLIPKLGLHTMWLAPGVGPVKIETPNGIAELIDYEIKAVASVQ